MRQIATVLAVFGIVATGLAQTAPAGSGNVPPDKLDTAKTAAYYLRYRDEIRAKEVAEAARRMLHTQAFKDALHAEKSSLPQLFVTLDRFVTATGITFDAVQLGLPPGIMRSGARVIAFGEVTDASGSVVSSFEEPAQITESKGDLLIERTMFLPVSKASASFGLAVGSEVIAIGHGALDAQDFVATDSGASHLIVSNNIYNMTKMQGPFEPFAFGGTKVVPKPDRAFHRSDEMWLFTEVRKPQVGGDGMPKLTMAISIESGGKAVAKSKMAAEPSPLKGVAGHYAVGTTVDLTSLRPGEYNVRLTVVDEIAKKSYERAQTVTINN